MCREVRRVPSNWQHPKDANGRYVPLYDGAEFPEDAARWAEGSKKWEEGLRKGDNEGDWIPLTDDLRAMSYAEWVGREFDQNNYMPLWRDDERTHLMMYELTSEGTPLSPAFATAEELARWLVDNNVTCFARCRASYAEWLQIISGAAAVQPVVTRQQFPR